MKNAVLGLMILTLLSANAVADTHYLCITDLVSGFHYDEQRNSWNQTTFLPGERFMLREIGDGVFKIEKLDQVRGWTAICDARTDLSDDSFTCASGANQFHFNRKLLQFTSFRYFGYWNGSMDSLSMSLGKCYLDESDTQE